MRLKVLLVLSLLFPIEPAIAIDTVAEGFRVNNGTSKMVDAHGSCRFVNNASGADQFVATKSSAEWTGFLASLPTGITAPVCTAGGGTGVETGFFVVTNATFGNGSLGGVAGADSTCLTDLQTYDWLGKSAAGTLTSARVKAFICSSAGCQSPQANKKYIFASSNFPTYGGASFIANASGQGPGDQINWTNTEYFGRTYNAWTGRAPGADNSLWPTTAAAETCSNWASTAGTGIHTRSDNTNTSRWSLAAISCGGGTRTILCMVHPSGTTLNAFTFFDQTNLGTSTLVTSNIVQITGLGAAAPVHLVGAYGTPEFRICSNSDCSTVLTTWQSASANISNNQYLQMRMATSSIAGTLHRVHAFIGAVSSSWSLTTAGTRPVGYLVRMSAGSTGNLGGLSGANNTCLTNLQDNDWVGKSSAGTLTAARVKAFLCDSTTCNNPQPLTDYYFATANSLSHGGAKFTSDASGAGPHNTALWSGTPSGYFGSGVIWTGRAAGSSTAWATTGTGINCNNWTSSGAGDNGTTGATSQAGSLRWSGWTATACSSTSYFLACLVHPE